MLSSRGHRRACNQSPIVIKRDPLVRDRDDDLERSLRSISGPIILLQFRLCVPVLVLVPERSVITPPGPVLGPKQELGVCDPCRKHENGKCGHRCRADGSHIDVSRDRCRHGAHGILQAYCRPRSQACPITCPATLSKLRRTKSAVRADWTNSLSPRLVGDKANSRYPPRDGTMEKSN